MHDDDSRPSTTDTNSLPSHRQRDSESPESVSKRRRYSPPASSNNLHPSNGRNHMAAPLKPLSLSILGVEPLDEFVREIADWVHQMIMSRPLIPGAQVEVEAKIGWLKYTDGNQRLQRPVRTETSTLTSRTVCISVVIYNDRIQFCSAMIAGSNQT